jgi:hypothetical protein
MTDMLHTGNPSVEANVSISSRRRHQLIARILISIILASLTLSIITGGGTSTDPSDLNDLPNPKVQDGQLDALQRNTYALKKNALLEKVFESDPVGYTQLSSENIMIARQMAADATKSAYDIQQFLRPYFLPNTFQSAYGSMTSFDQMILADPVKMKLLLYIPIP